MYKELLNKLRESGSLKASRVYQCRPELVCYKLSDGSYYVYKEERLQ